MIDLDARLQKSMEEITGNESLLEMLETQAAAELLEWGESMVAAVVKRTESLEDEQADALLEMDLKAVRQAMRATGNWAVGKYTDPDDRVQLREKLLGYFRVIFGEQAELPSAQELDLTLNQVDEPGKTPLDLIQTLKDQFTAPG